MVKLLVFSGLLSIWAHACTQMGEHHDQAAAGKPVSPSIDTTAVAAINFDSDIKPIFERHCEPCHFKGGKMYERMPFDQAKTIRDHSEGIFRRIKDPDEVKKLTVFLKQTL